MDGKRVLASAVLLGLLGWAIPGFPGGGFLRVSDMGGDGGPYVNLIVREVRVTPVRAHVGDPIRIDMAIEHQGEGTGTTSAEIRANGKVVANSPFTYGFGAEPGYIYRMSFLWDTKGVAPGEYRIRGEVFLWHDASEFDNFLDLKERLVLLAPGQPVSESAAEPGTAVAVDPRWTVPGRAGKTATPEGRGGY